jgi:hypothetical protein
LNITAIDGRRCFVDGTESLDRQRQPTPLEETSSLGNVDRQPIETTGAGAHRYFHHCNASPLTGAHHSAT